MDYSVHPSAIVDEGCKIGKGTKIWHFSHIMPDCEIGENCNIGQNVVISPQVILGNNVKVQNNVSIYTGVICEDDVFLGPSMVFTNVINPRSAVNRRDQYLKTTDNQDIKFEFQLTYFNSASTKMLFTIFQLLNQSASTKNRVLLNWHFDEEDDTIKEFGEEIGEDFPMLDLNLIETTTA
jgi:NDP-sugar pyrophosphorylase family protein